MLRSTDEKASTTAIVPERGETLLQISAIAISALRPRDVTVRLVSLSFSHIHTHTYTRALSRDSDSLLTVPLGGFHTRAILRRRRRRRRSA